MAEPGDRLRDPATGARLVFRQTAASSGGATAAVEIETPPGWTAGPLHVHRAQTERIRVLEGRFRLRLGRSDLERGPGSEVVVPAGQPHTVRSTGGIGRLRAEFSPALRTDDLLETMFGAGSRPRPPAFVPPALRAWVESLGYGREIRYLWPRRLALGLAPLGALLGTTRRARA
jgi:mannose-6-phosphate isomerase-like protein (cupin superfamily)